MNALACRGRSTGRTTLTPSNRQPCLA